MQDEVKTFFKKKKFRAPHNRSQRETPKLLTNSKINFFNLKITVLLDLA